MMHLHQLKKVRAEAVCDRLPVCRSTVVGNVGGFFLSSVARGGCVLVYRPGTGAVFDCLKNSTQSVAVECGRLGLRGLGVPRKGGLLGENVAPGLFRPPGISGAA